jgi:hypothetical protein
MTTPVAPITPPSPAPVTKKTNTLAIISLAVGIAPILLIFIPYVNCLAFLCHLAAIILGIIALTQISKTGGVQGGKGKAIAGICLGGLWVVLVPVIIIGGLAILGPSITNIFNNVLKNIGTSGY